jgi:hypothetical protein
MSIAALITEGIGPGGSIEFLLTGGLGIGAPAPVVVVGGVARVKKSKRQWFTLENGMRVLATEDGYRRLLLRERQARQGTSHTQAEPSVEAIRPAQSPAPAPVAVEPAEVVPSPVPATERGNLLGAPERQIADAPSLSILEAINAQQARERALFEERRRQAEEARRAAEEAERIRAEEAARIRAEEDELEGHILEMLAAEAEAHEKAQQDYEAAHRVKAFGLNEDDLITQAIIDELLAEEMANPAMSNHPAPQPAA